MNKTSLLFAAAGLAMLPGLVIAGEGGTVHMLPGANVTLVDLLPTALGSFGV